MKPVVGSSLLADGFFLLALVSISLRINLMARGVWPRSSFFVILMENTTRFLRGYRCVENILIQMRLNYPINRAPDR